MIPRVPALIAVIRRRDRLRGRCALGFGWLDIATMERVHGILKRARVARPSASTLGETQRAAQSRSLTYPEAAATFSPVPPRGYFHDTCSIELGRGDETFAAASRALRSWSAHHGARCTVTPPDAALTVGQTVTVDIPVLGGHVIASCRIVAVVDEPGAFGFAYGTLTDHPERGEESFVVRREGDGAVTFTVTAFSRPRELLPWIGLPIVRRLQHRAAREFLNGMRDATARELSARSAIEL